ncbi:MAG: 2-amino-4-hydroxy-6-hydroxymethyldihydropteridine diphosphokinase [Clostridiales bacterium]
MSSEISYFSIGSNLGDRLNNLIKVIDIMSKTKNFKLIDYSNIYETSPVGFIDQSDFLNMVLKYEIFNMSGKKLLYKIKKIEEDMGRTKSERWGPRLIDIDILIFGNERINEDFLKIPHKEMFNRAFVMIPLKEVFNNNELYDIPFENIINKCSDKNTVLFYKSRDCVKT